MKTKRHALTFEEAEAELELDLLSWPTHKIAEVAGNLVNIGPTLMHTGRSQVAYARLWYDLGQKEATEIIKDIARPILASRGYDVYEGECPACGKHGKVTAFDYGAYYLIRHKGEGALADFRELKGARMPRLCYHGPERPPQRYEE